MTIRSVALNPSPETNWAACSQTIAELLAPADEESLVTWIGCMGALVAKKDKDGDVSELELLAYAQKLQEWPGDVVRDVLRRYPDENKWWPEWFDLRQMLASEAAERMALAAAYRRWIEAPDFMARREGIAPPEQPKAAVAAIAGPQEVPRVTELPVSEMTAEEIDQRRRAMQAAILNGGAA